MSHKQQLTKSKTGFTIIEVVLVLAIAGLIFLMVFVALPALQRSQRDTQRRQDMARVATAITQYQTNNDGNVPTSAANGVSTVGTFVKNYLNGAEFKDPDGAYYDVVFATGAKTVSATAVDHKVYVQTGATCSGERAIAASGKPRVFAVLYKLEGAGVYCADNQ